MAIFNITYPLTILDSVTIEGSVSVDLLILLARSQLQGKGVRLVTDKTLEVVQEDTAAVVEPAHARGHCAAKAQDRDLWVMRATPQALNSTTQAGARSSCLLPTKKSGIMGRWPFSTQMVMRGMCRTGARNALSLARNHSLQCQRCYQPKA